MMLYEQNVFRKNKCVAPSILFKLTPYLAVNKLINEEKQNVSFLIAEHLRYLKFTLNKQDS